MEPLIIENETFTSYDFKNRLKSHYFKHGMSIIEVNNCVIKMTRPKRFIHRSLITNRPWYVPKFIWKKSQISTLDGYPYEWIIWKNCIFTNTHEKGLYIQL